MAILYLRSLVVLCCSWLVINNITTLPTSSTSTHQNALSSANQNATLLTNQNATSSTNQTSGSIPRDHDSVQMNGVVGFVLVLLCMVLLYTFVDCLCCVCYQQGVLWQKCGFMCQGAHNQQHVQVPTIIITDYD